MQLFFFVLLLNLILSAAQRSCGEALVVQIVGNLSSSVCKVLIIATFKVSCGVRCARLQLRTYGAQKTIRDRCGLRLANTTCSIEPHFTFGSFVGSAHRVHPKADEMGARNEFLAIVQRTRPSPIEAKAHGMAILGGDYNFNLPVRLLPTIAECRGFFVVVALTHGWERKWLNDLNRARRVVPIVLPAGSENPCRAGK